ncbi:MAG TPA: histidine kinase, partial [Terriglobales bacterium]|nr:histidine kinase [Terriglobales bacterium]
MIPPILRRRSLWRRRAPVSPGEVRRIERWLATARVLLAACALVAVLMNAGGVHYSVWAAGLLAFYLAQGMIIILLLRRRQQSTLAFRLLVHTGDIIWPALISMFATGEGNPFFLFFVFVLAAAAYRWGLWETVSTAAASLIVLWAESIILQLGFAQWANTYLERIHLPLLPVTVTNFEARDLFMRTIYLLVMGVLLGYLAEQQKQLRAEKAVIAQVLVGVRVEAGLTGTLQEILSGLLTIYGASAAWIASQEANSQHVFIGEVSSINGTPTVLHWRESAGNDREAMFFDSAFDTSYVGRKNGSVTFVGLDRDGNRIHDEDTTFTEALIKQRPFDRLTTVSFLLGKEWWGRIFLFDPALTADIEEELRFLQEFVRQVGPAVYNVYLLRRLRLRAGAVERARFARELHDGAVQSLIAVEMQVDVLRRQAPDRPEMVTDELSRIQMLLREEVLKLRELMQEMKSLDLDSRKLLVFLGDTVERFQRETGISARFVTDLEDVEMPQQMCRELARIVQEGLVNVRKHSKAQHALVRLGAYDGKWQLVIEDDGRGFPFTGRLSQSELDDQRKAPVIIQ